MSTKYKIQIRILTSYIGRIDITPNIKKKYLNFT